MHNVCFIHIRLLCLAWSGQSTNGFPPELLKGKANNLKHRVESLADAKCTKRFLMQANMKIQHPILNNYQAVNLRHRFVRGFSSTAIDKLSDVWNKMGQFGITHQKFPLQVGILMDSILLTTQGFERQADKDQVPFWRDGKQGHDLQCEMVTVLDVRYFDHGLYKMADARPFTTASAWVHFARLIPYIKSVFSEIDSQFNKPDLATARFRDLWKGEYDLNISSLSAVLPFAIQQNPMTMLQRIREQLEPVRALLAALTAGPVSLSANANEDPEKTSEAKDPASIAKGAESGNVSKHIQDSSLAKARSWTWRRPCPRLLLRKQTKQSAHSVTSRLDLRYTDCILNPLAYTSLLRLRRHSFAPNDAMLYSSLIFKPTPFAL